MSIKVKELSTAKLYPVWVGFLEESIDENFLQQKFKKFGPIRNVELNKEEKGKYNTGIHFFCFKASKKLTKITLLRRSFVCYWWVG